MAKRTDKFLAAVAVLQHECGTGHITSLTMDSSDVYTQLARHGWEWNSLIRIWTQPPLYVASDQQYSIFSVTGEHLIDFVRLEAALKTAYPNARIQHCFSERGRGFWIGF